MSTEPLIAAPRLATATAVVPQRPRRRPAEPPAPPAPSRPAIQALHATPQGFILRGPRSQTFWPW